MSRAPQRERVDDRHFSFRKIEFGFSRNNCLSQRQISGNIDVRCLISPARRGASVCQNSIPSRRIFKVNPCEIRVRPHARPQIKLFCYAQPLSRSTYRRCSSSVLKCFAQSNIRVDVVVAVAVANNNDFVDLFGRRRDFGLQRGERIRRWRCLSTSSLSKVRYLSLSSREFAETILKNPAEFLSD